MVETLLAFAFAGLNHFFEGVIRTRGEGIPETEGLNFIVKWSAVRIFGLIAGFVGVILWADINRILFATVLIACYLATLIHKVIRYGTNE